MSGSNTPPVSQPPDSRTVKMGLSGKPNVFSTPKDPRNRAWFAFTFNQSLSSVTEILVAGPDDQLVVDHTAVCPDQGSAGGFLIGGTPNSQYRLTVGVVTTTGETIYDTALLNVVMSGAQALGVVNLPPQVLAPSGTVMVAKDIIAQHMQLMFAAGGGVIPGDPADANYLFAGIAASSANTGQPLNVIEIGRVEDASWTWAPGAPLFAGPNGTITADPPQGGIYQQIGTASTATAIVIRPFAPVLRA